MHQQSSLVEAAIDRVLDLLARGFSERRVAEALGLGKSTISGVRTGRHRLSPATAERILRLPTELRRDLVRLPDGTSFVGAPATAKSATDVGAYLNAIKAYSRGNPTPLRGFGRRRVTYITEDRRRVSFVLSTDEDFIRDLLMQEQAPIDIDDYENVLFQAA
jgi:transcriptional regulator with XRE-family HTH domain